MSSFNNTLRPKNYPVCLVLAILFYMLPYSFQDCPRPTNLTSDVIIDPDQASYATWFSFTTSCPDGYSKSGVDTVYCSQGSPDYWSPDPSTVSCADSCTKPSLTDTSVIIEPNTTAYNLGEVITFSCSSGDLQGPTTSACEINGTWDYSPEPSCQAGCGVPTNTNGTGPYSNDDEDTFTCNQGYALQGGNDSIASTCNAGYWNPPVICESTGSCVVPANTNGTGSYTSSTTETFWCYPGFTLPDGRDTIESTCVISTWNPPVDCRTSHPSGVKVVCDSTSMTVLVDKDLLVNSSRADEAHFDDENCVGYEHDQGNIALYTAYDMCLTTFEKTNNTIIYSNVVTYYSPETSNTVITRENVLTVPVRCELDRHRLLGDLFVPLIGEVRFTEEGYGNYSMSLDRFPDETFGQVVIDKGAEVILGEHLYFAVNLSSVGGLVVFIENCWATPTPYPSDANTYSFLEDGCPEDPTMQVLSTYNSSFQTFLIDAFAFIHENPQVFIHCEALVCDNSPSSRCAQGCQPRVRRGGRQTRGTSSIPRLISNGPLSSRRADVRLMKSNGSDDHTLGLPSAIVIGTVVGLVCLVVGMVAMFAYMRPARRGYHHGYRRVDGNEDDCDQ